MSRTTRKNTKGRRRRSHSKCDRCINGRLHKHKRSMPAPDTSVNEGYSNGTTYEPADYNDHLTPPEDIKAYTVKEYDQVVIENVVLNRKIARMRDESIDGAAKRHDDAYNNTHISTVERWNKVAFEIMKQDREAAQAKKPSLLKRVINYIKSCLTT